MSIADANRFRVLEARVDAMQRLAVDDKYFGPPAPVADTRVEALTRRVATLEDAPGGRGEDASAALTEVVAALQRRIASLENTVKLQQGMLNAIRDKRG